MAFPIPVTGGQLRFQDGKSTPFLQGPASVGTFAPVLATAPGTGNSMTATLSSQVGGGGGDDIVATFTDLELQPGSVVGGPVVLAGSGDTLYVVLGTASPNDAFDLSGYVDGDFGPAAAVISAFTTLALVRARGNFQDTDTAKDDEIERMITQISDLMQNLLVRRIELEVGREEIYENGQRARYLTVEQPIADPASVEVREDPFATEDIILAAEVRVRDRTLERLVEAGGLRTRWGRGDYQITYNAGYTSVPPLLVGAATNEVLFQISSAGHGPGTRVGILTRTFGEGGSESYEFGGLLQATRDAIAAHNGMVVL